MPEHGPRFDHQGLSGTYPARSKESTPHREPSRPEQELDDAVHEVLNQYNHASAIDQQLTSIQRERGEVLARLKDAPPDSDYADVAKDYLKQLSAEEYALKHGLKTPDRPYAPLREAKPSAYLEKLNQRNKSSEAFQPPQDEDEMLIPVPNFDEELPGVRTDFHLQELPRSKNAQDGSAGNAELPGLRVQDVPELPVLKTRADVRTPSSNEAPPSTPRREPLKRPEGSTATSTEDRLARIRDLKGTNNDKKEEILAWVRAAKNASTALNPQELFKAAQEQASRAGVNIDQGEILDILHEGQEVTDVLLPPLKGRGPDTRTRLENIRALSRREEVRAQIEEKREAIRGWMAIATEAERAHLNEQLSELAEEEYRLDHPEEPLPLRRINPELFAAQQAREKARAEQLPNEIARLQKAIAGPDTAVIRQPVRKPAENSTKTRFEKPRSQYELGTAFGRASQYLDRLRDVLQTGGSQDLEGALGFDTRKDLKQLADEAVQGRSFFRKTLDFLTGVDPRTKAVSDLETKLTDTLAAFQSTAPQRPRRGRPPGVASRAKRGFNDQIRRQKQTGGV